jgi:succinate dehydrogenase / fumarate reductase, cytochrome b subunit
MPARPLSPHLTVYRFAYTMTLSILHRMTGVALAVGLLLLSCWLMAAAQGPATYARVTSVLSHGPFQLVLGAWLVAYVYHLGAGIRHLNWDLGRGFEKAQARRSGRLLVVGVVLVSGVLLYLFFCPAGARP